jgi:hypothetical protein
VPQEARNEREPARDRPAAREGPVQEHGRGVELLGALDVLGERAVLVVVPRLRGLLRDARAVADEPLDEVVRHSHARGGPRAAAARVADGQRTTERRPEHQHEHREQAARARREDHARDDEVDAREQRREAAAERERLERL